MLWLNIFSTILYKFINPNEDIIFLLPSDGCWLTFNFSAGYKQYFPYANGIFHISERSKEKIANKYTKDGFVEVKKNDTVIDIGAFAGEFSLGVSEKAGKIVACEPSPRTVYCLEKNTQRHSHMRVIAALVGERDGIEMLQIGTDPTDNSIFDIDTTSEDTGRRVGVPSVRLTTLIEELPDIDTVDFLKLEAEGGEPEVLDTIAETPVRKVAVDAGAERYGETTVDTVSSILTEAGFEIQVEGDIVYGVNNDI
jgi:FkbM family methyltransferase